MEELTAIRHHLHKHPELSKEESETQLYLLGLLDKLQLDKVDKVASTGILVQVKGKAEGKNILFRGDMDALPIDEEIFPEYRSVNEGVSHKCGHDGHSTIMYGLSKYFSEQRPEKGNVYMLFQPAEEIGWGAEKVEESKILDDLNIDYAFALHNVPAYPLHEVVCKVGSFTPAVTTLIAYFKGYTSHAAEPWHGRNPAAAISEYLLEALKHNMEKKEVHEFVTVTPAHIVLGEKAYGTSAGQGSVHLTIRADTNDRLNDALAQIKSIGEKLAKKHELKVSYEEQEAFESNQNDEDAVNIIKQSAAQLGLSYHDKDEPFRWGEDFGLFTNRFKGAMFGLGSGESCKPLHHPEYDFPDEIISTAIDMFTTIQKGAQQ
ncbi:MAG: amidohydrolase [Chitinophagaceae bacterium]|nr:amidohydrolase [Chitinophagaceae bacterium]